MRDNLESEPGRRQVTARVAGPAMAAGAVALGLVVIGACGLRPHNTYVAPPPLAADLPAASGTRAPTSTTFEVYIPPSPTWRVAVNTPPRRTPTSSTSPNPATPGYAQYPGYPYDTSTGTTTPSYATPAYVPPPPTDDPYDNGGSTTTPSGPP